MKLSCNIQYVSYGKTVLQLSAKADDLCHLLATGRARYGAWDMQSCNPKDVAFARDESLTGAGDFFLKKKEEVELLTIRYN